MMPLLLLIPLVIVLGSALGFGIGYLAVSQFNRISNKILLKRAKKMVEGKIDNKYELDGKKQDVYIFRSRDEKGKETVINLTK